MANRPGSPAMDTLPRYSVRSGAPADGKAILRVHLRAILAQGTAAYSKAEVRSWAAGLVPEGYGEDMAKEGATFLVAVDGMQRVIAFCSYMGDEVTGLYVDPAWSRRGVGRDLLKRAETDIAAAGNDSVGVVASLIAQPFYESEGYELILRRSWKTRGGLEIDVLDMEKPLA